MNSKIKLGDGLLIRLLSSLLCLLLATYVGPDHSFGHDIHDSSVSATDSSQTKSSGNLQTQNMEENSRRDIESYVLKWTNHERKKRGLTILETNPTLGKLAQIHSRNQSKSGLMAHDSVKFPEGWQTFEERMKKLLFVPPIIVGENVFWSSARLPSEASGLDEYARKMVKAWMTSENHRKNILHPNFSRIGIGFFNGYVTQLFASQDPIDLTPES